MKLWDGFRQERRWLGISFFVLASLMLMLILLVGSQTPLGRLGQTLFVAGCTICGVSASSEAPAGSLKRWYDLGNSLIVLGTALLCVL